MTKRYDPVKMAYNGHKARAKRIGVAMMFTREEWVAWWEAQLGPDWLKRRGKLLGQYVMARHGDAGPYHPNNVKCILHSQNVKEAKMRYGIVHHNHKLTEAEIIQIRRANGTHRTLALQFGVSHRVIGRIRSRKYWPHIA
jgi:hypothetical protein